MPPYPIFHYLFGQPQKLIKNLNCFNSFQTIKRKKTNTDVRATADFEYRHVIAQSRVVRRLPILEKLKRAINGLKGLRQTEMEQDISPVHAKALYLPKNQPFMLQTSLSADR